MFLTREVHREYLASILEIACSKCKKTWHIESSPIIKHSAEIESRYSANWGCVGSDVNWWGRSRSIHKNKNKIAARLKEEA